MAKPSVGSLRALDPGRIHDTARIISSPLRTCQRGRGGGFRELESPAADRLTGLDVTRHDRGMIELADIVVEPPGIGEVLDVPGLFGQRRPIEMEIGCGKGGFLLRQAREHPDRNYLGIEWANKYYLYAADRFRRWGLTNVRIIRTDARHLVVHQFPARVLSALHVYHPDPWPKKRHHKRRLFTPEFVDAAVRALLPGARWAVQSDHAEYFEIIAALLRARPELEPVDFDDPDYGTVEDRTETNFEVKYLREGRTIHRLAVRKAC